MVVGSSSPPRLFKGADQKVSIRCYNGPAAADYGTRFSDFRIVRLLD